MKMIGARWEPEKVGEQRENHSIKWGVMIGGRSSKCPSSVELCSAQSAAQMTEKRPTFKQTGREKS